MRSLLLIAAVLIAGALALEDGQKCEPGSTFKKECNTCRCSADGKLISCTRKFCVPEEQGDDPKVQPAAVAEEVSNGQQDLTTDKDEEHVHTNGQVCTPNEVKMEECNRCKCAANGIGWFCTRKACPPREKRSADAVKQAPQCTPGTSFKSADGCNDCFCSDNGMAACTMKFCFFDARTKRQVTQPSKNECLPGTSFKSSDGCNDCFCTENGIAACTMKFCFFEQPPTKTKREVTAPQKKCEPGSTFKHADGCNDCFCTETGVAACTAKFCFENPRTKRQVAKSEKQCEPGTSFKSADGCNDCFCSENGMAACTLRFCFFEDSAAKRPQRDVRADPEKCVPGTTFMDKDGCNTCFCTETGHAACTEKLCLPVSHTKRAAENEPLPVSKIAPGAPGFTCNPGKSFKYQCNTCLCDTNGQMAACTFKFCLEGEY